MDNESLELAARLLREGRLVAFPTETVYGLGADATQSAAVLRIFEAKGRPSTNPLIVHIASADHARRYARQWPDSARLLADAFWPGPLTLVVPRAAVIAPEVSAGLDTVGLRCPRHPVALALLERFDGPVAAPSANRSNRVSPTTAEHVRQELGERVDLILDGGACEVGIESTVLTLCTATPTVLRPGGISPDQIRAIIGDVAVRSQVVSADRAAVSPGQHLVHYSPETPCYRYENPAAARDFLARHQSDTLIILTLGASPSQQPCHHSVIMPAEPAGYARHLYSALRSADARRPAAILIEMPPADRPWLAVLDRLRRATKPIF